MSRLRWFASLLALAALGAFATGLPVTLNDFNCAFNSAAYCKAVAGAGKALDPAASPWVGVTGEPAALGASVVHFSALDQSASVQLFGTPSPTSPIRQTPQTFAGRARM